MIQSVPAIYRGADQAKGLRTVPELLIAVKAVIALSTPGLPSDVLIVDWIPFESVKVIGICEVPPPALLGNPAYHCLIRFPKSSLVSTFGLLLTELIAL